MNNLERWGSELALLIRRRDAALAELADIDEKWDIAIKRISAEPSGTLYGSNTGEQPAVATWTNERARVLPTVRPMRPDHQDGGNTFRLTPIADVTETLTMPAVVPCPDAGLALEFRENCAERVPHIHTADGVVKRVAEL